MKFAHHRTRVAQLDDQRQSARKLAQYIAQCEREPLPITHETDDKLSVTAMMGKVVFRQPKGRLSLDHKAKRAPSEQEDEDSQQPMPTKTVIISPIAVAPKQNPDDEQHPEKH